MINPVGWVTAHYNRHGTLTFPLPASAPADASPIADYDYQFADLDGKITQETRTAGGSATQVRQYTYDGIGRLATYTKPNGTVRTYTMDLDSNRTGISETPSGGTATTIETLVYDPLNAASDGIDEMTSRTVSGVTTTYTYDADGRTTVQAGGVARTLTWDGRDRMTQAVQGANTIVNTYDPEGALRRRSVNGGSAAQSREYMQVNDGGGFELNLDGTISSTSISGPGGGLIAYSGAPAIATTAAFQYFNAHGDSAATANATGVRQDGPNGYDPYGSQEDGTTPAANAAADRWTGRWHKKTDTSLSLIQMGARQYDLATGRFLTVDPIDGGSLNNYEYAGQDPINQYDLDGRQCRRATPAERAAAIRRGQPFLADWVCWSVKPWQKKPVRWLIKKVAIPCGRGAVGAAFAGGTIQWISKVYIGTRAAGPAGAWFSAAACIANVAYQG